MKVYEGVELQIHSFVISVLNSLITQLYALAALIPGK